MKNRVALLVVAFLLLVNGSVFAQKTTLTGTITDAATDEPLPGASVFVPVLNTGAIASGNGSYSVELPASETVTVIFSLVGYGRQEKQLNLKNTASLYIKLQQNQELLSEVKIIATKQTLKDVVSNTEMSTIKLQPSQIKDLPALGGEVDVIKVAQLLPGVKRGGEGQTGLYVRGGGADQNLILLDDAPVYNISHLFGFFSIFNNDVLKEVSLVKGSFPAQYGGRISSVMDIKTLDGDAEKIKVDGGIGLLSSRLTVQGPIQKKKLTFLVSGRRSYIDKALGVVGLQVPYYFYDGNARLSWHASDKDKISFSSYYGNDVLSAPKAPGSNPGDDMNLDFGFTLGNFTNTLKWQHQYSDKLFSTVTLLHSRFRYQVNGRFADNSLFIGSFIEDAGIKLDYDYYHNAKNQIRYGASFTSHTFRPNIVNTQGEISEMLKSQEGMKYTPQEMAAYVQNDFKPTSRLSVTYGLRASGLASVKKYAGLEPRLAAGYQLTEKSAIKAGYSRMFQYLHLVSNSSVSLPTDLWYPVTDKVKPQYADQLALSYTHALPKINTLFTTEVYYKKMHRLIEYKEGTQLLLNDNYEDELLSGKGDAYGAEFFLNKTEGRFTGWVGYSLSWATRQFDGLNGGKTFFAKYDRRHDLSLVASYKISERISVSGVWVYATGQRFTGRLGQYLTPNPGYNGVSAMPIYTSRNALKFSPSHRLDLNLVIRSKPHKTWQGEWHIGAYNVYNQTQPYKVDVKPNGQGGYQYEQKGLFGFIPSVAYNFKF